MVLGFVVLIFMLSYSAENPSGIPATNRHRQAYAVPGSGNNSESLTLSAPWAPEHVNVVRRNDLPTSTPSQTAGKGMSIEIILNL